MRRNATRAVTSMAGNAPCYECAERHMKCHAECEKYASYLKLRDEKYHEYRGSVVADDMLGAGREKGKAIRVMRKQGKRHIGKE